MWFLWKQFQSEPVPESVQTSGEAEDVSGLEQKILSFSMDGKSAKGAKQWHLEGDSAELVGDTIHLNVLKAIAYGDNVVVNLTSDSGIYDKEKGEVELIGNVEVISDEGSRLTTEKARWSQDTKEIYTDVLVKITRAEMTAIGTGGRANSDEKWAKLLKNVTVKMEPDTNVQCDGALEVSQAENKAVFYDNVKVVDKDGKLFSDKLTVLFDPENSRISKVIAEGNVKLKKGNSYTISEKAEYSEGTKSAKLSGRPRIIIDPEELERLDSFGMDDIIGAAKDEE